MATQDARKGSARFIKLQSGAKDAIKVVRIRNFDKDSSQDPVRNCGEGVNLLIKNLLIQFANACLNL